MRDLQREVTKRAKNFSLTGPMQIPNFRFGSITAIAAKAQQVGFALASRRK
jgi:hypothetical protein